MSDQFFWYLSRSSGLLSWLAAAGAILVGTMIPSRLLGRRPTIPWLTDLHRMLAAMASVLLLIHMAALWFDEFVAFRLDDLLIPFAAEVPGLSRTSLALGVVAAWLVAAVELSSLVRDRLPERLWRQVHLTSYLILVLGSVHAVLAGSDVGNPIIASIGTSALTAVLLATLVRVRRMRQLRQQVRVPPPETNDRVPLPETDDRVPPPRTGDDDRGSIGGYPAPLHAGARAVPPIDAGDQPLRPLDPAARPPTPIDGGDPAATPVSAILGGTRPPDAPRGPGPPARD